LIDRYYAGDTTPEEHAIVSAWFETKPGRRAVADQFAGRLRQNAQGAPPPLMGMWQNIQGRLHADLGTDSSRAAVAQHPRDSLRDTVSAAARKSPPVLSATHRGLRPWIVSSVFGLILILGLYQVGMLSSLPGTSPSPLGEHTEFRRFSTARGQQASLELDDGTRITLGVASTLTVPRDFGRESRTLILDGEALFSVTQNSTLPFIIRTSTTQTRVLGTTFTVRGYAPDTTTTVTVFDGKVAFADTIIAAGQRAVKQRNGRFAVLSTVGKNEGAAWVNGRIAFEQTSLRDVLTELNRWYDIQFVLDDPSIAMDSVTVSFINRSAEEVATVLDEILGLTHRRTTTQILFSKR
jgi:ferric-dicitrate binding protein FerR (iron transport regulator)